MIVFSDTTNNQGLYQDVMEATGQDNLSIESFTRKVNFAMDDYSSIVMSADGKWKFDDSNNTDTPSGYTQVTTGQRAYTLDANFLQIERVEIKVSGKWQVVTPIDQRDSKDISLETLYPTNGTPKYYDYDGQQIKLYPAPDFSDSGDNTVISNNSLRVDHSRPAVYFSVTDTTVEVGIPRVHHEYLSLKAQQKVMFGTNDPSISSIERELVKWEGREVNGVMTGGKIREYFKNRDENTVRRIKPIQNASFTSNSFRK